MKLIHFGSVPEPLLGTLHLPQRLQLRKTAILLCNPFGEEANRAHRIYRVLATQLERLGYPVLRFDYHGTGDSFGESRDASVSDWLRDVSDAATELARLGGVRRVIAFGLRLGGTLAAHAAVRYGGLIRHAILWDPVVNGAAYLDELVAAHRSYMRAELGAFEWMDRVQVVDGVPTEALGTPISRTFGAELKGLALPIGQLRADNLTVISTMNGGLSQLKAAVITLSPGCWIEVPSPVAWNSDAALNASVVPTDVVRAVLDRVQRISQ